MRKIRTSRLGQKKRSSYENKAGYTAVRCVPLVMTLLASSLVALLSSPASLPPAALSPSPHPPLTIACLYPSAEVENTHFCVLEKKTGYGPTDGRTDGPSHRDARTHLKID